MSASYTIFPGVNLKYVQLTGRTSLDQLKCLADEFLEDPLFDCELRQLIDLRGLTDATTGFWEMVTLKKFYADLYRPYGTVISVTIIAPSPFTQRLTRMFRMVMADRRTMDVTVVRDLGAALDVLHIHRADFDSLAGAEAGSASMAQPPMGRRLH